MFKSVIIDDEAPAIKKLENVIGKFNNIEVCCKYTNPVKLLEEIENLEIDIAFIDIDMPEMTGIELAQMIVDKNPKIEVIFVTAYNEYALEAFEVHALDYILKPVKKERLEKVITHIERKHMAKSKMTNENTENNNEIIIRCFGKIDIIKNGIEMNIKWRTAKERELFALYLYHKKRKLHRNEILELLWPNMEYERAIVNFNTCNYQLKKHINNVIDIEYENGYYKIQLGNVRCDVDIFYEITSESSVITKESIDNLINVLKLCEGIFFQNIEGIWIQGERYVLEKLYIKQLNKIAYYFFNSKKYIESIKYAKKAISKEQINKESFEILLKALDAIGDYKEYEKEYFNMKKNFLKI